MTTNSSTHHSNVVPSEVGWQFVPQYYTFVNKEPHRLHCFYSKTSTFVHGTEGEEVKPCNGQQEIHKKITSIGFEDCRVFIHSVDAQSSANGGIIIQVIGEMSNHGEPWRKFVQTFFLAEQPNGYFVLNDIFRFLKEESVEADDASESAEPETTTQDTDDAPPPAVAPESPVAPAPVPILEPVFEQPHEAVPAPPAPAVVVEPAPALVPAEEVTQIDEPASDPTQTPPAPEQHSPAVAASPIMNGHAAEPENVTAAAAVAAEPRPSPSPVPVPATTTPVHPQHAAAPQQSLPPSQRSWASLAASNPKKWGAVAQDTKGVSETVTPSSAPGSGTQTPAAPQTPTPASGAHHHGRPGQQRNEHPAFVAAQNVTSAHCFVKAVTEQVSQVALNQTLSRFGPIKDLDIVRQKACAFLEYNSAEFARKAIIASLNHNQGGEGGVYVDAGGEQIRIYVETKKEKGDRPPSRPHRGTTSQQQVNGGERGGAPQGGGNFRGRSGGQRGGGRGGSQK